MNHLYTYSGNLLLKLDHGCGLFLLIFIRLMSQLVVKINSPHYDQNYQVQLMIYEFLDLSFDLHYYIPVILYCIYSRNLTVFYLMSFFHFPEILSDSMASFPVNLEVVLLVSIPKILVEYSEFKYRINFVLFLLLCPASYQNISDLLDKRIY